MAVISLSTSSRDSATPEIVVNRWQSIGGVAGTIVAAAFRARSRHLWAMREQALACGDISAAEDWHQRLVEHETTDWLAEVAR